MIVPPYKVKLVEPIKLLPYRERKRAIEEAGFNPFLLPSKTVFLDLVSDSGTSAMSIKQLGSMFSGDESFAFQEGFYLLRKSVKEHFGFPYVLPMHQGRAIEDILFEILVKKGDIIPSNSLFETTRVIIERNGGEPIDLPGDGGDIDIKRLKDLLKASSNCIPFILMTLTNNTRYGLPVSLDNLRKLSLLLKKYNIPVIFDASRFAENCYFIWKTEKRKKRFRDVVKEVFSFAETVYMSTKKDGLCNTGGLFMTGSRKLYNRMIEVMTVKEGFPSHGGLPDRDIWAIVNGLEETLEEDYIQHRIYQVEYLHKLLKDKKIPVFDPPGGHAVYIIASKILPDHQFPGFALASEIFVKGGIRVGVFGGDLAASDTPEYIRLSIPRRVYTERHLEYVAEVVGSVVEDAQKIPKLNITYLPREMRIFGARFRRAE